MPMRGWPMDVQNVTLCIISSSQRFWGDLCPFFQIELEEISVTAVENPFSYDVSPPEYSKPWISVTESLICIILVLDSWEQSPHALSVSCPWSHLEIPRLKKIVGIFSQWWRVLILALKCKDKGKMRTWWGLSHVCTHIPNCAWKLDLFSATCHFNASEFGIES